MIRLSKGNLLEAPAEALVNTVNTEGVMGKGIALQFIDDLPVDVVHCLSVSQCAMDAGGLAKPLRCGS